jgi:predicted dehydrogenase
MGSGEIKFYLGPNWRKIRKIIRRGKGKIGKIADIPCQRRAAELEFK